MIIKRGEYVLDKENAFILWFDQVSVADVPLVGGKNASLGEMYTNLTDKGVNVPNGFAITAKAYFYILEKEGIKNQIKEMLTGLDTRNIRDLQERGRKVRELVLKAPIPDDLQNEIIEAYRSLCGTYNPEKNDVDVAVRSSATAEDLPDASFAGQQETYLNIMGEEQLLEACKKCFASLFTNRAISYRVDKGFDHFKIGLSIGVQKMVRSDKACSGVMFSIDTESGFRDVVLINGAYGLGENIVQGVVNPDEFIVFKPTLKKGFKPIIGKKLGSKEIKMIYDTHGNKSTKNIPVQPDERNKFVLCNDEILTLARWAALIEDHYSEKAGYHKPMDMEWAKDGITNQLFIVQARPETVNSLKDKTKLIKYVLKEKGNILLKGQSVGDRIGSGRVRVIEDVHNIHQFKEGEVLVTDMTDPDWEPIMKIAGAIVTNRGGRTCHAAIISRELGIPCIVGTEQATKLLHDNQEITVDASQGAEGHIYQGLLKYELEEHDLGAVPKTKTKIMMNIANPDQAFEESFIPNQGVGLAREEFIINSEIKIHPLALIKFNEIEDKKLKSKINSLTNGYSNKEEFFVNTLARGIGKLAAAFYPKPVIVRTSDFKSNEYANLIGGHLFEPIEDNPMIGWRGASRYYNDKYKEAFALECKALLKARNEFGLINIKVMIPFCRTLDEANKVLQVMKDNGLVQGENGLEIYAMCEIPSNVILADEFLNLFDGFSIGSNDLTQLTLGLDRDSELVSDIYDERNEAVKRLIRQVINVANKKGKYIGICGEAPSTFIDFAEFLVEAGIQSMSLNADTVIKTTFSVAEVEKKLGIYPK
ncbi:MAG: phosphoenolpyruvate synthase [Nanoarchaeota archaeon]|nr:phosphoenolpyruvate synthase [Nanoarchaeota archaeon]MBU1320782.1 phosphoenolpyruvate synthase [Nanoarchaeota archaeon]MBU1598149.1 phosphoenolpyruvate synthase [Nanoarchaeota archaeon]MBU2442210.1 phosphoenolpyruvate synthase [Nanoarchaeota archaeon]